MARPAALPGDRDRDRLGLRPHLVIGIAIVIVKVIVIVIAKVIVIVHAIAIFAVSYRRAPSPPSATA